MYKVTIGTDHLTREAILELYNNVGWIKYTENPDNLYKAFMNSTYVVSIIINEKIIGIARSISDDISIHYLQDILVHTDFQKQGVGRILLEDCLLRFNHVRTHVILTDNEERQRKFYESLGYKNTKNLKKISLNCFVKMADLELT